MAQYVGQGALDRDALAVQLQAVNLDHTYFCEGQRSHRQHARLSRFNFSTDQDWLHEIALTLWSSPALPADKFTTHPYSNQQATPDILHRQTRSILLLPQEVPQIHTTLGDATLARCHGYCGST